MKARPVPPKEFALHSAQHSANLRASDLFCPLTDGIWAVTPPGSSQVNDKPWLRPLIQYTCRVSITQVLDLGLRWDCTVCNSFISKAPAELEKFLKAARLLRKERAAPRYKAPTGKRSRLAAVDAAGSETPSQGPHHPSDLQAVLGDGTDGAEAMPSGAASSVGKSALEASVASGDVHNQAVNDEGVQSLAAAVVGEAAVAEKAGQLQGESADDAGVPIAATAAAEVAVTEEKAMRGEPADLEGALVPVVAAAVAAEGTLARVAVKDEPDVAAVPGGAALVAAKGAPVAAHDVLGNADEEVKASGSTASGSGASGAAVATVFADEVRRFVMGSLVCATRNPGPDRSCVCFEATLQCKLSQQLQSRLHDLSCWAGFHFLIN